MILNELFLNLTSADCPCEHYNCDAIQGSNTSILVLYSYDNYAFHQHVLSPDGSNLSTNYELDTNFHR